MFFIARLIKKSDLNLFMCDDPVWGTVYLKLEEV